MDKPDQHARYAGPYRPSLLCNRLPGIPPRKRCRVPRSPLWLDVTVGVVLLAIVVGLVITLIATMP